MEITLPILITGFLASVLTEIGKLFPIVKNNEIVKSGVAILLAIVGGIIVVGKWDWQTIGSVILSAFISYKFIVQPVANQTGLTTQK